MTNRFLFLVLAVARVCVHAQPVLRFEGLGAEAYNCPEEVVKEIKRNIDRAVNKAAIEHDVIDADSDLYMHELHEGNRRGLRRLSDSDSSDGSDSYSYDMCSRNGCPRDHRKQYCWIIVSLFSEF